MRRVSHLSPPAYPKGPERQVAEYVKRGTPARARLARGLPHVRDSPLTDPAENGKGLRTVKRRENGSSFTMRGRRASAVHRVGDKTSRSSTSRTWPSLT